MMQKHVTNSQAAPEPSQTELLTRSFQKLGLELKAATTRAKRERIVLTARIAALEGQVAQMEEVMDEFTIAVNTMNAVLADPMQTIQLGSQSLADQIKGQRNGPPPTSQKTPEKPVGAT